jgi:hypothetical protein
MMVHRAENKIKLISCAGNLKELIYILILEWAGHCVYQLERHTAGGGTKRKTNPTFLQLLKFATPSTSLLANIRKASS